MVSFAALKFLLRTDRRLLSPAAAVAATPAAAVESELETVSQSVSQPHLIGVQAVKGESHDSKTNIVREIGRVTLNYVENGTSMTNPNLDHISQCAVKKNDLILIAR